VAEGVSPGDFLDQTLPADANVADSVGGVMFQILERASGAIYEQSKSGHPCTRAAAALASQVVWDEYAGAPLLSFLRSLRDAAANILTLGEKGVEEFLIEQIQQGVEGAIDDLDEYVNEQLSGKPPEVGGGLCGVSVSVALAVSAVVARHRRLDDARVTDIDEREVLVMAGMLGTVAGPGGKSTGIGLSGRATVEVPGHGIPHQRAQLFVGHAVAPTASSGVASTTVSTMPTMAASTGAALRRTA
jgi:hypothetical protein